jgi:hypothetical protein
MKNVFRIVGVELKKELYNCKLYISLIGYILLCFYISGDYGSSDAFGLIDVMLGLSNTASLLVFIAALPSACTFVDDWENGYYKFIVSRSSSTQYIISKILTCAISTFLVSFIGFSIFGIIEYIMIGGNAYLIDETDIFYSLVTSDYKIYYIFLRALILALLTALFAEYGLMGSAIMPNKFASMTFPLISTVILIEFSSKIRINHVSLHNIQSVYLPNAYGGITAVVTVILYLLVANIIFTYFVKRRIRCEIN